MEQAPEAPKSAEIPEKVEVPEKVEAPEAEIPGKTEKADIPEKMEEERNAPPSEDKTASLKIQSESGSCRTGKLVYAADGAGDGEGVAPVIEIVLEGKQDEDRRSPLIPNS